MNVNTQLLITAGLAPTQAKQFSEPLRAACALFSIDTPNRLAAFLAQVSHESARFTRLEESLFYNSADRICAVFPSRVPSKADALPLVQNPKALANRVYSGRLGNGGIDSNDGWRYRGRGLIQLTGRANYAAAGEGLGLAYLARPDLVALPSDAALTAAWFWHANGCNQLADNNNFTGITRRINGPALLGLAERREAYEHALHAFA